MLLFFAIFKLLARAAAPAAVAVGAAPLLGAVGAELLKWLSAFLIGLTKDQPAFQAFGIALILLVWINYFSRVVVYAAAWAHTAAPRLRVPRSRAGPPPASATRSRPDGAAPAAGRAAIARRGAARVAGQRVSRVGRRR